jgi:GxxExxY protein
MQVPHEPPLHVDEYARGVIGAAIEVHRHLGPGYLESAYEEALVVELKLRRLSVSRQIAIPLRYKSVVVGEARIDLLVEDELVVELKSVDALHAIHHAQLVAYLKAGAFQLGLLINFNVPLLKHGIRRVLGSG